MFSARSTSCSRKITCWRQGRGRAEARDPSQKGSNQYTRSVPGQAIGNFVSKPPMDSPKSTIPSPSYSSFSPSEPSHASVQSFRMRYLLSAAFAAVLIALGVSTQQSESDMPIVDLEYTQHQALARPISTLLPLVVYC